jgi:hypothetical protein
LIGRSDPWFLGNKTPRFRRLSTWIAIVGVALLIGVCVMALAANSLAPKLSDTQWQWCVANQGTVSYYADNHNESYTSASQTDGNFVSACRAAYSRNNP